MCVASAGFTSFYNGLVVFTLLGFMAKQTGMTVTEVASQSGTLPDYSRFFRILMTWRRSAADSSEAVDSYIFVFKTCLNFILQWLKHAV